MEDIIFANEQLNKWCGTEGINYYEGITALGNLFKYAVPSKKFPGFHLSYEYYLSGFIYRAKVCTKDGIWGEAEHKTDPALALFWALKKAIKKMNSYIFKKDGQD